MLPPLGLLPASAAEPRVKNLEQKQRQGLRPHRVPGARPGLASRPPVGPQLEASTVSSIEGSIRGEGVCPAFKFAYKRRNLVFLKDWDTDINFSFLLAKPKSGFVLF